MLVWGTEASDMRTEPIAKTVLDAPLLTPMADVVQIAAVAETIDRGSETAGAVDVAGLDNQEATGVQAAGALRVLQAADAPPDAIPPLVSPDSATLLIVIGTSVNMRAGPSTDRDVIGAMRQGERAERIAETVDGWVQVRNVSSGQIGYMAGRYLTPGR